MLPLVKRSSIVHHCRLLAHPSLRHCVSPGSFMLFVAWGVCLPAPWAVLVLMTLFIAAITCGRLALVRYMYPCACNYQVRWEMFFEMCHRDAYPFGYRVPISLGPRIFIHFHLLCISGQCLAYCSVRYLRWQVGQWNAPYAHAS
jgi:hypothetical protein